jgi:hypothetical protein
MSLEARFCRDTPIYEVVYPFITIRRKLGKNSPISHFIAVGNLPEDSWARRPKDIEVALVAVSPEIRKSIKTILWTLCLLFVLTPFVSTSFYFNPLIVTIHSLS